MTDLGFARALLYAALLVLSCGLLSLMLPDGPTKPRSRGGHDA